jgi:hypothetical protein
LALLPFGFGDDALELAGHCPAETKHIIVGTGDGPRVVLAVGAREYRRSGFSGGYTVDEAAPGHGAGVNQETTKGADVYAGVSDRESM